MKKIFCFAILTLSLFSYSQEAKNKVITQKVFTVDERVSLQIAFDSRLSELNLTDDQLYKYTTIIDDNVYYMINYNKKGNRTKAEMDKFMNKTIDSQNKKLQKLLSPEQYKKHLEIYQTTILTPIKNRMNTI